MILLDTNHLTLLRYPENPQCHVLAARMQAAQQAGESFSVPIICIEEQMRGWLAELKRRKQFAEQAAIYDQLALLFAFFSEWEIAVVDSAAVAIFERLCKAKVRIGTMDLKIAAIALAHDALLLTADFSDFSRVPQLRVENWLKARP